LVNVRLEMGTGM